jgi:2-methylisocitrate lyase-like PEP mutase family enzyme
MTANAFRKLHYGAQPLLLPNAWDAGSARLIESLGAKAIATTSGGLAWSRGYPDGDALPVEQVVAAARDIARVVDVPLTIDLERGYSDDPNAVVGLVRRLVDLGVVGLNLEDGAGAPDELIRRIDAIRPSGVGAEKLFVNIRTDVYLRDLAPGAQAVAHVIDRAQRYRVAGCDGIFVPGLIEPHEIDQIVEAIEPLPLNVMVMPGLPTFDVLAAHGVRRISTGTAIAQAALGCVMRVSSEFLDGSWQIRHDAAAVDYRSMNSLLAETAS